MPNLEVQITYSFRGVSRAEMERTISVDQETLDHLFPQSTPGQGVGWPYAHQAEAVRVVCAILREELFQNEVMPVETVDDLKRLGIAHLHANFKAGQISASVPFIG